MQATTPESETTIRTTVTGVTVTKVTVTIATVTKETVTRGTTGDSRGMVDTETGTPGTRDTSPTEAVGTRRTIIIGRGAADSKNTRKIFCKDQKFGGFCLFASRDLKLLNI